MLKNKLNSNFHALSHVDKILYFLFVRPFWPKEKRFFFEGSLLLIGQMYAAERKGLYDIIVQKKPKICFEIGTFTGGGSTFFLASAFHKNGSGKLITLETDERLYNKAKEYYAKRLPHLVPYVTFVHGDSFKSLETYIDGSIDSFFLDGAENAEQTLEQYNSFLPYCKIGTIMMAHDWNTEKLRSVRPLIEKDSRWKKLLELQPPASIGFVIYERI